MKNFLCVVWLVGVVGCSDRVRHTPDAAVAADAAIDAPSNSSVHVALAGNGKGTVTSTPDGITCGSTCSADFAKDTMVTLTATPDAGSVFGGWSGGGCSGTATTCTVELEDATNVTATFTLAKHTVTVAKAGAGMGTVSGDGITCGATCTITVDHGTTVSLAAAPANLSVFAGWGGPCTGMGTCEFMVTDDVTVDASFALDNFTLFAAKGGNGDGTITSSPAGISCGTTCNHTYSANQMVTLTAMPASTSLFTGWSGGGCSGTGTCTVTVTSAQTVTATFTKKTYVLTVTKAGTGSGTVTGTGISCGTDCTETLTDGTMLALTASAATGSTFAGWSGGGCTGTGTCTVTMDAAKTVTATFTKNNYTLTVQKTGSGTVSGGGIDCGTTCSASIPYNMMVTLTAAPAMGWTFAGWGGACSGMGSCSVTMDAAKTVTAAFTVNSYSLTVMKAGNGGGTVMGSGIDCGTTCSSTYTYGSTVTLSAAPDGNSNFTGWSGACSGTGSCSVTIDAAKSVTATFTKKTFTLRIAKNGTGAGTVTGGAINCGGTCSTTLNSGDMITLTAMPDTANATASTFAGWSGGGCAGTGACTVTVTAATTVTATFTLKPNIMFLTDTLYTGALGGLSGADAKCQTEANNAHLAGTYVAYLSSGSPNSPINAPSRVGSATGWVRPDGRPIMNTIDQLTAGTILNPPRITATGVDIYNTQITPLVWTGTSQTGTLAQICSAAIAFIPWGGTAGTGTLGIATETTFRVVSSDATGCGSQIHLYCLGTDRAAIAQ